MQSVHMLSTFTLFLVFWFLSNYELVFGSQGNFPIYIYVDICVCVCARLCMRVCVCVPERSTRVAIYILRRLIKCLGRKKKSNTVFVLLD